MPKLASGFKPFSQLGAALKTADRFLAGCFLRCPPTDQKSLSKSKQTRKTKKCNLFLTFHLSHVNTVIGKKTQLWREKGGAFKLSRLPFPSVISNVLNKLLPAMLLVFFNYFQILTDNYFNSKQLGIVSFSLSLFRFDCNL